MLADQLVKKEKECFEKTQDNDDLTAELENIKKVKSETFTELMTTKECLTV